MVLSRNAQKGFDFEVCKVSHSKFFEFKRDFVSDISLIREHYSQSVIFPLKTLKRLILTLII